MRIYHCKHCGTRFVGLDSTRVRRCPQCDERLSPVWMPELPRAAPGTYPEGAWASIEDFVSADARRLASREIDFGLYWRRTVSETTFRASWIEDTGELYVIQSGPPDAGGGHVEVLAITDRATLEGTLEGWATRCLEAGSLDWIRARASRLHDTGREASPYPRLSAKSQDLHSLL